MVYGTCTQQFPPTATRKVRNPPAGGPQTTADRKATHISSQNALTKVHEGTQYNPRDGQPVTDIPWPVPHTRLPAQTKVDKCIWTGARTRQFCRPSREKTGYKTTRPIQAHNKRPLPALVYGTSSKPALARGTQPTAGGTQTPDGCTSARVAQNTADRKEH